MTIAAPPVDTRSAAQIASQVRTLLERYAPSYTGAGTDPITGALVPDPRGGALIGVFTRFAELIIERLNRVPDKNFLAFLDLIGASRLPPQPARVPLTFSLAKGSASPGVVPPGTQVAAPPGEGEKDPIIFETERELVVTPAALTAVFSRDQGPIPRRPQCAARRCACSGLRLPRRAADRSHRLLDSGSPASTASRRSRWRSHSTRR